MVPNHPLYQTEPLSDKYFYIGCVAPFNPCFAWSCTLSSTNCLPSYPLRHFCIAIGTNIKNYKIRFFLFVLYQLSYLPMMGRVGFEPTTTDFADQRKIFAVRILMAVPRRIELRSLDRQSSIMATIRWNYIIDYCELAVYQRGTFLYWVVYPV